MTMQCFAVFLIDQSIDHIVYWSMWCIAVVLGDSVLGFHKHGMQGLSSATNEVIIIIIITHCNVFHWQKMQNF